jgi:hypothetical protein
MALVLLVMRRCRRHEALFGRRRSTSPTVIPETPQALSGNFIGSNAFCDPLSARRHFMP